MLQNSIIQKMNCKVYRPIYFFFKFKSVALTANLAGNEAIYHIVTFGSDNYI